MRNTRHPGPPSTLSGSSASGRALVRGHNRRSVPVDVFVPGDTAKTSSGRKTKIILILGIALPVLACIIGITAWAVTTDVLRITPRSQDSIVNNFGRRGKSRENNLQTRQDEDVDVFMLNSLSQEDKSSSKSSSTKRFTEMKNASKDSKSVPVKESTPSKQLSPSDILSKLISDMPIPKNSKNFVVFAPVADTKDGKKSPQARRLDGKVHVSEGDDLIASESIASETMSQEAPETKNTYIRKRKSHKDSSVEHDPLTHNGKRQPEMPTRKFNTNERISLLPVPSGSILNSNPGIFGHMTKNSNFQQLPQSPLLHSVNSQESFKSMQQSNQRNTFPQLSLNAPSSVNIQSIPSQHFQALPPNPSLQLAQNLPQQIPQQAVNQNMYFPPTGSQQGLSQFSASQKTSSYLQNLSSSPIQSSHFGLSTANQQNSPNFQSNSYSPENSNMPGAPQYFAPPPQNFHTKVNYENSNKLGSLSSYEKIGQTTTAESSKDGGHHHHHHHHHHHEPTAMGSDPIGDINLSDVPLRNDADRLGTIGLGLGSPRRGITVQIGGGPGGGGLGGGLLPLSALGMARNIVSALMPRPALGLNSKVFVGLELGRGRGLRLLG